MISITRLLIGVVAPLWASGCSLGDLFGSADDDPTSSRVRLEFAVEPANVLADEPIEPAVEITVLDSAGAISTEFRGSVTVELVGSASGALEGTKTREVENGVAVFSDLAVDKAGSGNRLRASADGIESIMSEAFDVIDPEDEPDREPRTLEGISGAGQRDTVRATLEEPYVVRVTDSEGEPVAGVRIIWEIVEGGGSVTPTSSLSGSDGEATARHTLGVVAGAHFVTAAVEGLNGSPATFGATATHGRPVEFVYTVPPRDVEVNEDITPPVEVTARDGFENTATSWFGAATVSLAENPGGGTLSGTRTRNGDEGVITFSGLRINRPGDGYQLRVSAEGFASAVSGPFDVMDDGGSGGGPGEPATITRISGDAQTGTVGEALDSDYVVRVLDDDGAPVSGVSVTWTVSDGNGSVSPTTSTTNDDGRASTRHSLGVEVGTHAVEASVDGLAPVTFSATAAAGAPAELEFTTQPSNARIGRPISPAVRVTVLDRFGNTVTDFSGSITVSIRPGSGTPGASLSGTRTRAVSNGVATFDDLSINLIGVGYRLRVVGAGLTTDSNAFNVLL